MMKTFVAGDIHGAYLAFKQVLDKCGINYDNDTLITLGDIVDGYPDTYKVVEELLKIKNRIDIKGNHDDWFETFIDVGIHPDSWRQGGVSTAKSYAKAASIELKVHQTMNGYMLNLIPEDIPKTHQNFFKHQNRYYKDDNNNLFVHGGFNRMIPIKEQSTFNLIWDRNLFRQAMSVKNKQGLYLLKFVEDFKHIFIGHTTTKMWGTDKPIKADIIWNLDTGAGWGGKLTIMNVNTEEYWQSDLVKELYPNEKGR